MNGFRILAKSDVPGTPVDMVGVDSGFKRLVALAVPHTSDGRAKDGVLVIHTQSRRSLHGMRGMGTTYENATMSAYHITQFRQNPDKSWEGRVSLFGAEFSSRGWDKTKEKK